MKVTMKINLSKVVVLACLAVSGVFFNTSATADTYVTAKNGFPDMSIWVTLYEADKSLGVVRTIRDSGCLNPGESRAFRIGTNDAASNAYLRSELKQNRNCTGNTLHDTTVNSGAVNQNSYSSIDYTLLPQSQFPATYWEKGILPMGQVTIAGLGDGVDTFVVSRSTYNNSYMVLGIDPNDWNCQAKIEGKCAATLRTYQPGEVGQIWIRKTLNGAHVLINKLNNMVALVAEGNGNQVFLYNQIAANIYAGRWTIGGNCSSNCALRPIHDSGQNLNIFGNGPYGPGRNIGTWGWSGGQVNETWWMYPAP